MNRNEITLQINKLEKEINKLPSGSISKKTVKGKDYYYHRINSNGKRSEKYIDFNDLDELVFKIEKRKELEKKLKELKKLNSAKKSIVTKQLNFKTIVRVKENLRSQIESVKKYKKRECIKKLREYIFSDIKDKVFIIYGLRRTGKTTMIRQILNEMSYEEFNKAAFIQVSNSNTLEDINNDLHTLENHGYKYVFIDEVTLMEDFIENASIFSDIYASSGMKIVLSGTDSLGFLFSKDEQLYDRCILLHTTFIPYYEFEEVLGIKGIDEYIRYGGTMSISGVNYNVDSTFSSAISTEAYIDSAIAKNIQHSLKMYQNGGHFRQLEKLYEKGELTNVINAVVENINHRFTSEVVEKTFKSSDLSITANNLLKDKNKSINIKEHIDIDKVTSGIKKMLQILNSEEKSIEVNNTHMIQIKEYLTLLDLIQEIDIEYLPDVDSKGKLITISQPGLRYAQAKVIVENLLLDSKFKELSIEERDYILLRLLNEIKGRMMEEIVLLETRLANPSKQVFKLQFPIGEFDMVVVDNKVHSVQIYEIKYSDKKVVDQYRHINDEEKCKMVEHRYGHIINKRVIYRGKTGKLNNIEYINVEEYLLNLKNFE